MNDMAMFPYLPHIEWEWLGCAIFDSIVDLGPLPQGTAQMEVSRADDYSLVGKAMVTFAGVEECRRFIDSQRRADVPGTISRGSAITGSNRDELYRVNGTSIYEYRETSDLRRAGPTIQFELALRLASFHWERIDKAGASLTDWYLNGPHEPVWTRGAQRNGAVHYERRWNRREDETTKTYAGDSSHVSGFDHFYVKCTAGNFMVHQVPDKFGPAWSASIGIEYEVGPDGNFPDSDQRTAISELVGFVFGRRLIHVASTTFDKEGCPIAVTAKQPWGNNVQAVCSMNVIAPVNVSRAHGGTNVETVIESILPQYIRLRSSLRLGEALWRLWLGNEASLGINLTIYSAGLDMLASAWFKSTKSKSKGVYLPKDEFEARLDEVFQLASEKLDGVEYKDRILRRISGSFQTGISERTEWFFDEIGLPIDKAERAALKARNASAHGADSGATNDEFDTLIHHRAAMSVLFARTVLKILGYTGLYIDRSTIGFTLRELHEPAGG